MVPNPAIRNLIREDKVHQIYSSMQVGQAKFGMQTFNQALAALLHAAADHPGRGVRPHLRSRGAEEHPRQRQRRGNALPGQRPGGREQAGVRQSAQVAR